MRMKLYTCKLDYFTFWYWTGFCTLFYERTAFFLKKLLCSLIFYCWCRRGERKESKYGDIAQVNYDIENGKDNSIYKVKKCTMPFRFMYRTADLAALSRSFYSKEKRYTYINCSVHKCGIAAGPESLEDFFQKAALLCQKVELNLYTRPNSQKMLPNIWRSVIFDINLKKNKKN